MERVLVVDSNHSLMQARMSVVEAIRDLGLTARGALTASAVLDLIRDEQYSLAIIELELPDMDGFELIREMRFLRATREIPIILLALEYWWKGERVSKIVEGWKNVYLLDKGVKANVLQERISRLLGDLATHSPH